MKAYEFKITLSDYKPSIWRKFVVPADITFKRLHDTIQMVMGWQDYHLYEFEFKSLGIAIYDEDDSSDFEVKKPSTKIDKYVTQVKSFNYIYDFGDYWQHKVELVKVIDDYEFGYPQILSFKGNCPPEDCGGTGGYEHFLEAWDDTENEEHEDMKEWGESQGYGDFDKEQTNRLMKEILKLKKVKK